MRALLLRPILLAVPLFAMVVHANSASLAADVPKREGKVTANGVTIAYEDFGPVDREAVLLIMGNGTQLTAWPLELIEELVRRGYRVVIYDNRDVGLSTKFDEARVPDAKAVIEAQ